MAGIFGSSGKTANPAGTVGSLVGAIGAGFSVVLWIYHFNPDSTLLGKYSQQLAAGGQMADQLGLLAVVFGGIAVVLGIVGGLGGRGGSTTVMSILLPSTLSSSTCRTPSAEADPQKDDGSGTVPAGQG
jgi:hypothetical protein